PPIFKKNGENLFLMFGVWGGCLFFLFERPLTGSRKGMFGDNVFRLNHIQIRKKKPGSGMYLLPG
ncbi:hypothetical protein ACVGXP_12930, partial [Enterobacter hormaechei]